MSCSISAERNDFYCSKQAVSSLTALKTISNFIIRFAILPQLKLIWPHSHLANVDYVTMEILFTFEAVWVFPVVSLTHCEP